MKTSKKIALFTLLLAFSTINGQKVLQPEDYSKWHYLGSGPVSPNGQWLSYFKKYSDTDTLFLKHMHSGKVWQYPNASGQVITKDGALFVTAHNDTVSVVDLNTQKEKHIVSKGYIAAANKAYLVIHDSNAGCLEVVSVRDGRKDIFYNVIEAKPNPVKDEIIVLQKDSYTSVSKTILLDYSANLSRTELSTDSLYSFTFPYWNKTGNSLALYRLSTDGKPVSILHYNFKKSGPPLIKELMMDRLQPDFQAFLSGLFLSDDGDKVLFDTVENEHENPVPTEQALIWNTATVKPLFIDNTAAKPKKWVWFVNNNMIKPVETTAHPNAILSGDHTHALVFNGAEYLPAFKSNGEFIDYYLMDLLTGNVRLLVEKIPYDRDYIQMSPKGKYILYFKDRHWWSYNIARDEHICITKGIKDSFLMSGYDMPGSARIYAVGGWKPSDEAVYLHGKYDVWMVDTDGNKFLKITDGEKSKTRYRIYDDGILSSNGSNVGGYNGKIIKEDNVILHSQNTNSLDEGYSIFTDRKGIVALKSGNRHYYSIRKIPAKEEWIFFESDFDQPATLYYSGKTAKPQIVARANEQQRQYFWGRSELIHYDVNGKELNGALFYPAGYDANKQYPMVVYIYEKLSNNLHKYCMPSIYSDNGVNISNFTLNGYFVLCPDISYMINEPGKSALDCVTVAVNQAQTKGSIDSKRLGLIGHSFGGYEVTYILGQSNIFKAAVAGAPVTDLRSHYLLVNSVGRPNFDNFEGYQYRITLPFYDLKFEANSPITFADKIHTPLLMWTSDRDTVVSPYQSIQLQTALWRMGKPGIMLMYPQEDHSLMEEKNQKDLSGKVLEWFDYYLKNSPKPYWIN